MTNTFKELQPHLPEELCQMILELHKRNHDPRQAWEYQIGNPDSIGLPAQTFTEWLDATLCVTYTQHVDDGKILPSHQTPQQEIERLYSLSQHVITIFCEKYQKEESRMRQQNFVNSFLEDQVVKLSTLDPITECINLPFDTDTTEDQLDHRFNDQNWKEIKEFDPECFRLTKKVTAKAGIWLERNGLGQIIIPVEVLGDVLMLKHLLDKIRSLQKDINQITDANGTPQALHFLESVLEANNRDFSSRICKYALTTLPNDPGMAVLQVSKEYTGTPEEIIAQFGKGCLCVPWTNTQQSKIISDLK